MGVKFKEKTTGFIVEFEFEVDIESTRTHPDYEELKAPNEEIKEEPKVKDTVKPKSKG